MKFPQARILVFAKAPVSGQVKTRLAEKYGYLGAAAWYKTMVHHTLNTIASAQLCPIELWCSPDVRHGFFANCRYRYDVTLKRQHGIDLGQRMHNALTASLRQHPYALLMGTDCVSLTADDVADACTTLDQGKQAVLGPAQDGGYVLIGLRQPCAPLFRGITWSTPSVLQATRQRLQMSGLDWAELAPRWDVDHPQDLRRWKQQLIRQNNHSGKDSVV